MYTVDGIPYLIWYFPCIQWKPICLHPLLGIFCLIPQFFFSSLGRLLNCSNFAHSGHSMSFIWSRFSILSSSSVAFFIQRHCCSYVCVHSSPHASCHSSSLLSFVALHLFTTSLWCSLWFFSHLLPNLLPRGALLFPAILHRLGTYFLSYVYRLFTKILV